MIKRVLAWTALVVAIAAPASAETRTYFGFQIGISNAPPPPYIDFYDEPEMVYVPTQRVYVVDYDGCDVFRYGSSYYACQDGYWYRSRGYGGPFAVIDVRYVPEPIFRVPSRHWRHRNSGGWGHRNGYSHRGYANNHGGRGRQFADDGRGRRFKDDGARRRYADDGRGRRLADDGQRGRDFQDRGSSRDRGQVWDRGGQGQRTRRTSDFWTRGNDGTRRGGPGIRDGNRNRDGGSRRDVYRNRDNGNSRGGGYRNRDGGSWSRGDDGAGERRGGKHGGNGRKHDRGDRGGEQSTR